MKARIIVFCSMAAVVGAFVGAALVVAHAQSVPPPPGASAQARYEIDNSDNEQGDTFLLDNQEGRVWRLTELTQVKGSPTVWLCMPRVDSDAELKAFAARQEKMPDATIVPQSAPTTPASRGSQSGDGSTRM